MTAMPTIEKMARVVLSERLAVLFIIWVSDPFLSRPDIRKTANDIIAETRMISPGWFKYLMLLPGPAGVISPKLVLISGKNKEKSYRLSVSLMPGTRFTVSVIATKIIYGSNAPMGAGISSFSEEDVFFNFNWRTQKKLVIKATREGTVMETIHKPLTDKTYMPKASRMPMNSVRIQVD